MRLDRLHMLILFLFLPNRNAIASINKRIVLTQPTVILVSYDGFRWDYMAKVHTPNLNFIASNGIKAKHLLNTFVTKTFPNHFTLVTGLYEESHGIVANTFFDPVFNDTIHLAVRNIPKFKDRANWSRDTFQPMRRRACVYQQTNQNIAPVLKNFQNNGRSRRTKLKMSLQYSSRFHI